MKCRNCGRELEPGFDYCENCGTVLSNEERAKLTKRKPSGYTFDIPKQNHKPMTAAQPAAIVHDDLVPVCDLPENAEPEILEIFDEDLIEQLAAEDLRKLTEEAAKQVPEQTADEPVQAQEAPEGEEAENADEPPAEEKVNESEDVFSSADEVPDDEEDELTFEDVYSYSDDERMKAVSAEEDSENESASDEVNGVQEEAEEAETTDEVASDPSAAEEEKKISAAEEDDYFDEFQKEYALSKMFGHKNEEPKAENEETAQESDRENAESDVPYPLPSGKKGKIAGIVCAAVAVVCIAVGITGYFSGWFNRSVPSDTTTVEKTEKPTEEPTKKSEKTTAKEKEETTTEAPATTEKPTTTHAPTTTEEPTTTEAPTEPEPSEPEITSYQGYVPPGEDAPSIEADGRQVMLIEGSSLYASPSGDSYVVSYVSYGEYVNVNGYNSDRSWAYIALNNGYFGWVRTSSLD